MEYITMEAKGTIKVYDNRNVIFYDYRANNNLPFFFNLPLSAKKYKTIGNSKPTFKKLVYRVELENATIPIPENITFEFGENPSGKASFNKITGQMIFDNSFKKYPLPILLFLYFHEIGHLVFQTPHGVNRDSNTEWLCDKWSASFMLKNGYNESQVLAGMKFALSNSVENTMRYKKMVQFLNNVKKDLI